MRSTFQKICHYLFNYRSNDSNRTLPANNKSSRSHTQVEFWWFITNEHFGPSRRSLLESQCQKNSAWTVYETKLERLSSKIEICSLCWVLYMKGQKEYGKQICWLKVKKILVTNDWVLPNKLWMCIESVFWYNVRKMLCLNYFLMMKYCSNVYRNNDNKIYRNFWL